MMATTPLPLIRKWMAFYTLEALEEREAMMQAKADALLASTKARAR